MCRQILLATLCVVTIAAASPSGAEVPNAQFYYPWAPGQPTPDPELPGRSVIIDPCMGTCDPQTIMQGRVDGFALADGAPEVMARFNLVSPSVANYRRESLIIMYFRVVANGTDPFGELALVPLQMEYLVSLSAFPQMGRGRVTANARIRLLDATFGSVATLLDRRVCSSTEFDGQNACGSQNPPNASVFEQGVIEFNVLGSVLHEFSIRVNFHFEGFDPAGSAGFGGGYLDPLPRLDVDLDPVTYGRPAGFRLQDHYRVEYSGNHILGPRRPGEIARDGFE